MILTSNYKKFLIIAFAISFVLSIFSCIVINQRWKIWGVGVDTAQWTQIFYMANNYGSWSYTAYTEPDFLGQRNAWGNHFTLSLYLIKYLYDIFPHPLTLYYLQIAFFVSGGFLIGNIVYFHSKGDFFVSILVMMSYILYPPILRIIVYSDFSTRHFAVLILPLCYLLASKNYKWTTIALLIFYTSGIENLGLISGWFCFSLAFIYTQNKKFYTIAGIVFTLYPFLVIKYGLPLFRTETFSCLSMSNYDHIINNPYLIFSQVFQHSTLVYMLSLLLPLAFLPVIFPSYFLLAGIPFWAQNVLSEIGQTRVIGHHYTVPLAVSLFVCLLPLFKGPNKKIFSYTLLFFVLLGGHIMSPTVPRIIHIITHDYSSLESIHKEMHELVSDSASLSAPHNFASHFSQRNKLWFFPQGVMEADVVIVPNIPLSFPVISLEEIDAIKQKILSEEKVKILMENDMFSVLGRDATN